MSQQTKLFGLLTKMDIENSNWTYLLMPVGLWLQYTESIPMKREFDMSRHNLNLAQPFLFAQSLAKNALHLLIKTNYSCETV